MKKAILGLLFCTLFLTGCHVSSRTSMYGSGGRTSYNMAAQNTTNQELLLNLVRLRYSDTPYFLELNGITTQFNFSGKVSPQSKFQDLIITTLLLLVQRWGGRISLQSSTLL